MNVDILTASGLCCTREGTAILQEIDIHIAKGDCVSIIGPSGSGKSTLLRLLADLTSPSDGQLLFKGQNYLDYQPELLRREISYVVQQPLLFGRTVADNVYFPYLVRGAKPDHERIRELLDALRLTEDFLDKDVYSLSGGERQRISLMRHLLFVPEVLLLDEITSALDEENARLIEQLIRSYNHEGVTVLWVTHDLQQSGGIFDRRLTIDKGRLVKEEVLKG